MHRRIDILFLIAVCILLVVPCVTRAFDYVDSFESGDLLQVSPEGFSWGGPNRTKVLTEAAYNGTYSLRFRYPAGEPWSEQRFKITNAQKDLWIKFWLRVPTNYSFGPEGSPNKFFAIWTDAYSSKGDGSTVFWGMHRVGSLGDCSLAVTYSPGGYLASKAYVQGVPFITTNDRGRWMQMVLHTRVESSFDANDGIMETWRRWAGESAWVKLHELKGADRKFKAHI